MFRTCEFFVDKLEVFEFFKDTKKELYENKLEEASIRICLVPNKFWSISNNIKKDFTNISNSDVFVGQITINQKMIEPELESAVEKLVDSILAKHYRSQAFEKMPRKLAEELFPRNKFFKLYGKK